MKKIILILLMSSTCWARTGGVVSNGADDIKKAQVWFLGKDTFTGCIERNQNYSVSMEDLKEIVTSSFVQWNKYVENKQLKVVWPQGQPFLNFKFKLNPSCQGNEDIQFYFDTSNSRVEASLKDYVNPRGFSTLESYDPEKGRGKGFIWIDDLKDHKALLWSAYGQVQSLIMHELGHVYGCDHVAGTIMREDLANYLVQAGPMDKLREHAEAFPKVIEHGRELFFSFERGIRALLPTIYKATSAQKELFQKLFKRPIAGPVLMGFIQGADETSNKAQLFIGDQIKGNPKLTGGVFNIMFDQGSKLDFSSTDGKVFRFIYKDQERSFDVPGFIIQGRLIVDKRTGESIPVTYARNRGSDEYVRLMFASDTSGVQEFFRAHLYTQPYH